MNNTTTHPEFSPEVLAAAEQSIGRGCKPWPVTLTRPLRFASANGTARNVPAGSTVFAFATVGDYWKLTLDDEPGWYARGAAVTEFDWQD